MFKTLKDFSVTNKRILVRCDFNVPVDENGKILNDFRIRQTLPTIKYLLEEKAKIILMSHLDPESTGVADKKYNLNKVAQALSGLLGVAIAKADDCVGPEVEGLSNSMERGNILLLENLRFHKEEKDNDPEFAKKLSYLADIYANDAFSVCHRDQASVTGVPKLVVDRCAGLLLEKEILSLERVIKNPEKPMVALIGGTKVETKSKLIDKISEVADFVIISGLIAKEIKEKNLQFLHPEKIVAPTDSLDALDIDQKTINMFCEKISTARTVLWNGPFGRFEDEKHNKGTLSLAKAIVKSGAYSLVGGGETVEFLEKQGILNQFSHVSTGGGAMLAYLSGETLPGLEALK